MGKNSYSLKPMHQENAHWNQDWRIMKKRMRHFTHVLELKDFFLNSKKIFPTKEMHSVAQIIVHVKKLATKIKVFQSAFEVKDSAANGTWRQVN